MIAMQSDSIVTGGEDALLCHWQSEELITPLLEVNFVMAMQNSILLMFL